MRPHADYVALRDIKVPDSYAFAARAGHDVTEAQRINLNLIVGDDPATADIAPTSPNAMNRPDDDADRLQWQNYAVVRGVPFDEAVNLDRSELVKRAGREPDAPTGTVALRPEPGDKKAAWVEHAVGRIMTETNGRVGPALARERAEAATKADLLAAFGPDAAPDAAKPFLAEPEPETVDDAGAASPGEQG